MLGLIALSKFVCWGNVSFLTLSLLAATFRLLITFANSLDPDQDRRFVGPDLDPNHLTH